MSTFHNPYNESLYENTLVPKNYKFNEDNSLDDECSMFDEDSFDCNDSNYCMNTRQKNVVEWMITKESQEPHGGIIAAEMGPVSYKISIIMGLMFKSRIPYTDYMQIEWDTDLDETEFVFEKGQTLIVCSKTMIHEWIKCINKMSSNICSFCVHYGRNRDMSLQKMCQNDIVITTTTLVQVGFRHKENCLLYQIKWNRIILDDASCAFSYKLQTFKAVCYLSGVCHWVFAGSTFLDCVNETKYGLFKFINYKPLNNYERWKIWLKNNQINNINKQLKHLYYSKKII